MGIPSVYDLEERCDDLDHAVSELKETVENLRGMIIELQKGREQCRSSEQST